MVDHHRVGGTTGASISAAVAAVEAHASSDHEMNRVLPGANSEATMEQSRLPPLRQVCRSTVGVYRHSSEYATVVLRMKFLPSTHLLQGKNVSLPQYTRIFASWLPHNLFLGILCRFTSCHVQDPSDSRSSGGFGRVNGSSMGKNGSSLDIAGPNPPAAPASTSRDSTTRSPRSHMRHASESALPSAAMAAAAAAAMQTEPMDDGGRRSDWNQRMGRHRPPSR